MNWDGRVAWPPHSVAMCPRSERRRVTCPRSGGHATHPVPTWLLAKEKGVDDIAVSVTPLPSSTGGQATSSTRAMTESEMSHG